ncbi:hypothetical protein [uncultured Aquimarina sp.]|uniref:hypothetical protein n=1 Tax=uncultured Aquimarina sp. TaxID=575652 RepID=UPI00260CE6F2|nr:hypothetical protein [uncultured Aquimarina sp.]
MRKTIYILLLFTSLNSLAQELFEYDFDENLTLNVIDNSEEGEIANGKFVKGTFENETIVYLKSKKKGLKNVSGKKLEKLFEGIKDGALKASKGKLINEEIIKINELDVLNYKYFIKQSEEKKIIENYVFVYKENIYTIQFMNNKDEFNKNTEFRKRIIESIKLK